MFLRNGFYRTMSLSKRIAPSRYGIGCRARWPGKCWATRYLKDMADQDALNIVIHEISVRACPAAPAVQVVGFVVPTMKLEINAWAVLSTRKERAPDSARSSIVAPWSGGGPPLWRSTDGATLTLRPLTMPIREPHQCAVVAGFGGRRRDVVARLLANGIKQEVAAPGHSGERMPPPGGTIGKPDMRTGNLPTGILFAWGHVRTPTSAPRLLITRILFLRSRSEFRDGDHGLGSPPSSMVAHPSVQANSLNNSVKLCPR